MRLHLLIAGLFWPDPAYPDVYQGLHLPALETMLGRSGREERQDEGAEGWLCRAYGVARQQDWPIAPLTLEHDGGAAGTAYWLRADPVHLKLDRDRLVLADSGTFSISQAEANAFTEALNRHFGDEGLLFYPLKPDRWYLRLERRPRLSTHSLPAVAGKNINALLPAGGDAAAWRRLFNEIQMALHQHPVNEEREARGGMPVNSVWPWGGGVLPEKVGKPFESVFANDALALALAAKSGARTAPLPGTAGECLAGAGTAGCLVVLDTLRGAEQYGDAHGWREGLQQLEQSWFAPLFKALRNGRVDALAIHGSASVATRSFALSRTDLWKLWRPVKPFSSFAGNVP